MADPLEICIPNAGVYVKEAALKRSLEDAGIKGMVCVHKLTMRSDAYILFVDEAARDAGLPLIPTVIVRGSKLTGKPSTGKFSIPAYKRTGDAAPPPPKRQRADGPAAPSTGAPPRSLADAVTPWHAVPYEEQLARKEAAMRSVMQAVSARLATHAWRNVKSVPNYVSRRLKKFADAAVAKARDEEVTPSATEASSGSSAAAPAVGQKRKAVEIDGVHNAEVAGSPASAAVSASTAAVEAPAGPEAATAPAEAMQSDSAAAAEGEDGAAAGGAAGGAGAGAGAGGDAAAGTSWASAAQRPHPLANLRPDLTALLPAWLVPLLPSESEACPVRRITSSPITSAYRNKATMTVGRDVAGRTCAGHRTGAFSEGTAVTPPGADCMLYSPAMAGLAAHLNEAFFSSTPFAPVDLQFLGDRSILATGAAGVWHTLTLREATGTGEMMAILLTRPIRAKKSSVAAPAPASAAASAAAAPAADADGAETAAAENAADLAPAADAASDSASEVAAAAGGAGAASSSLSSSSSSAPAPALTEAELAALVASYEAEVARFTALCDGWRPAGVPADAPVSPSAPKVVSVMLQEWEGAASAPPQNHPHKLLAGRAHIVETMCGGLRFCISPGAFFQVNTPGADVLYGMVRNLAVYGAPGAEMPPVFAPVAGSSSGGGSSVDAGAAPAAGAPAVAAATTALADVCCGTGTIGLACARDFARIVGVELSSEAIDDAKRNAALNDIPNAVFLCERAENVMRDVLDRASAPLQAAAASASASASASAPTSAAASAAESAASDAPVAAAASDAAGADSSAAPAAAASSAPAPASGAALGARSSVSVQRVVAIVDPPRGGLHASVIKALRTSRHVKRLVYVSCNPSGTFIEDAVKLCTPQESNSAFARGPAFRPVLAAPMDMFPHTAHTELVCLFERD